MRSAGFAIIEPLGRSPVYGVGSGCAAADVEVRIGEGRGIVGSLAVDREPIVKPGVAADLLNYTDPLPQSLVLTAIVIGFATTALFLVVLLALRGLSGGDHVDGQEEHP